MLFLHNDVIAQVLDMKDVIQVSEEAFAGLLDGDSVDRPRIYVYVPSTDSDTFYRWGSMEGANRKMGVFAIRAKSDMVHWPVDENGNKTEEKYCTRPGLYCGLILLFSTMDGEPLAIINDGILQHMRVGSGGGLGAKYLSREDSHVVGMIGSGGMARSYLEAFCAVRDISQVRVYSPTKAHREGFAEEMSELLSLDVEPVDDARTAVRGADIVSACTDAFQPVVKGEWLEPGMFVTEVSGRELDDVAYERCDVVARMAGQVDPSAMGPDVAWGNGSFAFRAGSDDEKARLPDSRPPARSTAPYPTFTDLLSGKVGRTSRDQITMYVNSGMGNHGLQFAAVGWLAYEQAKKRGLGRELPTEWFLQDIRD